MKKNKDYSVEDLNKACYPDGKNGDFVIDENFMKPVFYNTLKEKQLAGKQMEGKINGK